MAKHNMLLGQARGKVGDLVFSRAFGKQIVRSKAASVANPKSYGQNVQRCILATIAKAAAALTPIVDHSFASIAYGAESVRHFRKINMEKMRNAYLDDGGDSFDWVPKGGSFMPGEFIISQGNLPAFDCLPTDGLNPIFVQGAGRFNDNTHLTAAQVKFAYPYLQGGDQLTLVTIEKISGNFRDGSAVCVPHYDRIVLSPTIFDDPSAVIIDGSTFSRDYLDLSKTTDENMLKVIGDTSSAALGFTRATGGSVVACALILSREVNGKWQRSSQRITMLEADDVTDPESSIASYGAQASLSDATEYLNQANEGTASAGVSGPYMETYQQWGDDSDVQKINVGGTLNLENMRIVTGRVCKITANAYGTDDNPLVALDLTGTSADGSYEQRGTIRKNTGVIEFNVGENVNLAGSYRLTAVYRNGRAVANFTLSTGA